MTKSFAQLGVPENICRALERRGITEAFEIQAATVADALDGRDVCGRAPTGSGKTLAFGVPLIATVGRGEPRFPRGLVLAPTRELADQITSELRSFSDPIKVAAVYGGVGYGPQLKALREGVDVLVACPGRLEDLIERGSVSLRNVDRVVLDEADRMADMGFMPAVRRLLDQTADERQTVLFSATLDGDVAKLTRDYQRNPVRHEVGETTPDITAASHVFWNVEKSERAALTAEAIDAVWPAIIFCRTRHGSDRLAKQLGRAGIKAAAIHGGRSQSQRTRALASFAKNEVLALVATDVAARGIHVDGVASVVHYDPPEDHKAYVHRSGRTARAGEGGVVVSLVQRDQVKELKGVQRKIGLEEPFVTPDAMALRALSPMPARKRPVVESVETSDDRSERKPRQDSAGGRPPRRKRPSNSNGQRSSNGNGSANGNGQRSSNGNGSANGKSTRSKNGSQKNGSQKNGAARSNGSQKNGAARSNGSSAPKANNRKARRAHLQRTADRG